MRAFLKKDPERIGHVAYVYKIAEDKKRLAVYFDLEDGTYSHMIDAPVEDFEVFPDNED